MNPTKQQLIDLLREVQWVMPISNSYYSCPCCGNMKHWGHADDCELAKILDIPANEVEEE